MQFATSQPKRRSPFRQPAATEQFLRGQAQHSVIDCLATAIAACLTHMCGRSPQTLAALPVVAYFICAACEIYGSYKESKALVLKTLNSHRMNIAARHWVCEWRALSPREVDTTSDGAILI